MLFSTKVTVIKKSQKTLGFVAVYVNSLKTVVSPDDMIFKKICHNNILDVIM